MKLLRSDLELISQSDPLRGLIGKHRLARVLERVWHWSRCRVDQVLDSPGHLLALVRALRKVLVLISLAEDLSQLNSGAERVRAEYKAWVARQEVADILKVELGLLLVVMERQQTKPVLDQVLSQVR